PVAVSDIPIFREIAAEAAEYFDPEDPRSIAHAIERLTDADRWAEQSVAGRRQSQVFDWAKSADSLVDLIRSVAADRKSDV
ncbi:glycosyltransferase family 1 protein, partial [Micrococcus sp. SIMBA_144]